ncbi:MAG: hypothetical protein F6K41_42135 [Symploca sp. SIO3E6]|nr:hypothetical protein [Caldora sp. SIO3E6]
MNSVVDFDYDNETGAPYLAARINESAISYWLELFKRILTPIEFYEYTLNQQRRDHSTHHMTVVNPLELPKIEPQTLEPFVGYPVNIQIFGIGTVKDNENETYFLVCQCHETTNMRKIIGLTPKDFHITLGFKAQDVFSKPKDKNTLIFPFNKVETNN